MVFLRLITLLLVFVGHICSITVADPDNAAFWQADVELNVSQAAMTDTEIKSQEYVFSQDFQAVQINPNAIVEHANPSLLFDFSYCCSSTNTSYSSLQELNNYALSLPVTQNKYKVALIKRGHCSWSEKMSLLANISDSHHLNVTYAVIYDNNVYNTSRPVDYEQPSYHVSFRSYQDPLPHDQLAANMPDNDLDNPSSRSVYFVSNSYGENLLSKVVSAKNSTHGDLRTFWLLQVHLKSYHDGNKDGNPLLNALTTGPYYLSYLIALSAVFLIGIVFLRWWRIRRMREGMEDPLFAANVYVLQQRNRPEANPLPVDIVNSLPTAKYSIEAVKNSSCVICLDDFVENKTDIRILPCGHGFCVLCIDPWLTQKSTLCPICKWDCLPAERREQTAADQPADLPPAGNPAVPATGHEAPENSTERSPPEHLVHRETSATITANDESVQRNPRDPHDTNETLSNPTTNSTPSPLTDNISTSPSGHTSAQHAKHQ